MGPSMSNVGALDRIIEQVHGAKPELDAYAPSGFGWHARCIQTAETLVPWLVSEAPELKTYVEDVLNSPRLLHDAWAAVRIRIDAPAEVARIDLLLERQAVLLEFVAGDTVSAVVTGFLIDRFPAAELAGNSKSDYPDLFIKAYDYSELPVRTRKDVEIGAAVRGPQRKPVRVPDGLEIKTSRDRASIDCHYPHMGLHLMLSFITTGERVVVDDVLAAFLRHDDYRITVPKTKATTLKASFSREPFVSLL